jgi:hypothetical protein
VTPPPELKSWSKRQLIREVERLRAITREHADRTHGEAPDRAGGMTDVAGHPYARGGVLLDMRGAVLLDTVDVALVDRDPSRPAPASLMLTLGGRVNLETRRSSVAYVMPTDGAAAICSELFGIAQRAGGAFLAEFQTRLDALP